MDNLDINEKIIAHCRAKFSSINKDYLKKNGIKPNIFLEIMYDCSLGNYYKTKDFTIEDDDFKYILSQAMTQVRLMDDYVAGKVQLMSISDNDHFFFKIRRQIENNNTEEKI